MDNKFFDFLKDFKVSIFRQKEMKIKDKIKDHLLDASTYRESVNNQSVSKLCDQVVSMCDEFYGEYFNTNKINQHAYAEVYLFASFMLDLVLDSRKYEFQKQIVIGDLFLRSGYKKFNWNEQWKDIAVVYSHRLQLYGEALTKYDGGRPEAMFCKIFINFVDFSLNKNQFLMPKDFSSNVRKPKESVLFLKSQYIVKFYFRLFGFFSFICQESKDNFEILDVQNFIQILTEAKRKDCEFKTEVNEKMKLL